VKRHLIAELGSRTLGSFQRDALQDFLDREAAAGLSFSVVAHLRFDLRQLFRLAVADGYIRRNPAEQLFTPRECPRPNTPVMTLEEVKQVFSVLDLRERVIARLAIIAGMRPGEIFGLKWACWRVSMRISDNGCTAAKWTPRSLFIPSGGPHCRTG
jgi:integrase